ncbi:UNVERIFIED_CONTAM: protein SODIUM POTASSIUM ROOT defective [Sesamum calycinum]|uniref:Protein SODIUM POTASSIUM ROOT defective n=1 Tax=Sesamum calycinum TaxID=2727403 RepID=A0AAW2PSL8_9LAMI
MKSIELFCASPASTAICSSMDQRAIIRPGIRPIDRQIHRLGDTPRSRTNAAPCSSQLPFDPSRPFYHKSRKNTAPAKETEILRRKSSADVHDLASPPSSSRYLLSDRPFLDPVSDSERALVSSHRLLRDNNHNYKRLNLDDFRAFRSLSSRAAYETPVYNPGQDNHQARKSSPQRLSDHLNAHKSSSNRRTVELRVSIHCKGCEGKLRKHISRMEGKSEFIQYRLSNKKSDSNRGRDPSRGTCQHFQGEECPILAISDFIFLLVLLSET